MKHWVTVLLRRHAAHPPTYPGPRVPELRAMFDESGAATPPPVADREYRLGPVQPKDAVYAFEITEAEYNRRLTAMVYLWAEPVGVVAFAHEAMHDGVAVGRIALGPRAIHAHGAIQTDLPALGIKAGDRRIDYRLTLVNSVVQFMADELTANVKDSRVTQLAKQVEELRDRQRRAAATPDTWVIPDDNPLGAAPNPGVITKPALELWNWGHDYINQWRWGRQVHKDEGPAGFGQEIIFLGGGQWDHKPRIRPVWGTYNRLGNLDEVWFYDIWSNIHYGCVGRAAGMPLAVLTSGAGTAQAVDSGSTTGDDVIDAEGIIAGYNLYSGHRTYTVDDLLDILAAHPHWEVKIRYPKK